MTPPTPHNRPPTEPRTSAPTDAQLQDALRALARADADAAPADLADRALAHADTSALPATDFAADTAHLPPSRVPAFRPPHPLAPAAWRNRLTHAANTLASLPSPAKRLAAAAALALATAAIAWPILNAPPTPPDADPLARDHQPRDPRPADPKPANTPDTQAPPATANNNPTPATRRDTLRLAAATPNGRTVSLDAHALAAHARRGNLAITLATASPAAATAALAAHNASARPPVPHADPLRNQTDNAANAPHASLALRLHTHPFADADHADARAIADALNTLAAELDLPENALTLTLLRTNPDADTRPPAGPPNPEDALWWRHPAEHLAATTTVNIPVTIKPPR